MPENDLSLPPEADAQLDDLLASWAHRHRLSPARTREIRGAILAPPASQTGAPAGLGWEWWQSTVSPIAVALSGPAGPVFVQPYLRLT